MTDELRDELRRLAEAATPGPWHRWHGDDDACMNAYAVTTEPCEHEFTTDEGHAHHVVALTLLQSPRLADIGEHGDPYVRDTSTWLWEENARYIAAANPQRILAMLNVVEAAREVLGAADQDADHCFSCHESRPCDHDKLREAIDRLEELE